MQSEHPDIFNIVATREEFSLLFGKGEEIDPHEACQKVRLTNRIIISPLAVKRLLLLLTHALRDYEVSFGEIDKPSSLMDGGQKPERRHVQPSVDAMEMARFIVELMKSLDVPFGMEWSFKMSANSFLTNRVLAGISKHSIKADPDGRCMALCREVNLPDPYLEIMAKEIPFADFFAFGVEDTARGGIYKVYLEFKSMCEHELRVGSVRRNRLLLYLGLKWDPLNPEKKVITEYVWHPVVSMKDIMAGIKNIYAGAAPEAPLDMIALVLSLAAARVPVKETYLTEVSEPGNPRQSFALNVKSARISLQSLDHFFFRLCRHYAIDSDEFQTFLSPVKETLLTNFGGGIDREGRDFLTFYYALQEGRQLQLKNPFLPPETLVSFRA
jgi:hypothetical protein